MFFTNPKDPTSDHRTGIMEHKKLVSTYLKRLIDDLILRGATHDESKLKEPEYSIFAEHTHKLKTTKYMSDEYKENLKHLKVALDHHYKNNRHHPEHFKNGIRDMTLVDLVEMICDWKASTSRTDGGDIMASIEMNKDRFGYSDEIKQILINTARKYF